MPINVFWDNAADDCLVIELIPPPEWNLFHQQFDYAFRQIIEVRHTVDVVIVAMGDLPGGTVLPHFRAAYAAQPANVGQILLVVNSSSAIQMFVQRMTRLLHRMYPRKGRIIVVGSLDEARRLAGTRRAAPV